jgi:hypothetical protein
MSVNILPVLGTQGFVEDPSTKFDLLLSHFFLSDYNQSHLYPGSVISLPRLIQQTGGDLEPTILSLKSALQTYLGNYFENVEVQAKPKIQADPRSKMEVELTITMRENNQNYGFTRLLKSVDSKLETIIKINNFG